MSKFKENKESLESGSGDVIEIFDVNEEETKGITEEMIMKKWRECGLSVPPRNLFRFMKFHFAKKTNVFFFFFVFYSVVFLRIFSPLLVLLGYGVYLSFLMISNRVLNYGLLFDSLSLEYFGSVRKGGKFLKFLVALKRTKEGVEVIGAGGLSKDYELSRLFVVESHQGKGLCTRICNQLHEYYEKINEPKSNLYLTCSFFHENAMRIYEKFGYEIVGVVENGFHKEKISKWRRLLWFLIPYGVYRMERKLIKSETITNISNYSPSHQQKIKTT